MTYQRPVWVSYDVSVISWIPCAFFGLFACLSFHRTTPVKPSNRPQKTNQVSVTDRNATCHKRYWTIETTSESSFNGVEWNRLTYAWEHSPRRLNNPTGWETSVHLSQSPTTHAEMLEPPTIGPTPDMFSTFSSLAEHFRRFTDCNIVHAFSMPFFNRVCSVDLYIHSLWSWADAPYPYERDSLS